MPLFVLLDVANQYWYWPGWGKRRDYESIPLVATGETERTILPTFTWPETGSDAISGIIFWGAMLNAEMTDVLGGPTGIGQWTFGFGP